MYPILFRFYVPFLRSPIELRSYGLMIALGVVAGYFVSRRLAKKLGLSDDNFLDLLILLLIFCIIGAKIMYVLTNDFSFYLHNPLEIILSGGQGLSFFGIVIAAIIVGWFYAKRRKVNFWGLLDVMAGGVLIGYAIGRIGCFLNGCCVGIPTESWFAFRFNPSDFLRIPTQLFTSILALIFFFVVLKVEKTKRFYGKTAGAFLISYSIITFFVEFWRDITNKLLPLLSWNQVSALIMIPAVIVMMVWLSRTQPIKEPDSAVIGKLGTIIDESKSNEEEKTIEL